MPLPNRPSKITIDFAGVEVRKGGGSDHIPEGDYLVETHDIQQTTKKDDSSVKMLVWDFRVAEPAKYKGKRLIYRTVLTPESLWSLRSLLIDLLGEEKVPQSRLDIPLEKIIKARLKLGVSVQDDEYKGKLKSEIQGTFSKADWQARAAEATGADVEDEEEVDEEEVKSAAVTSDDDEDMDEIDVDDI